MPVPTRLRQSIFLSLAVVAACLSGCERDDGVRVYAAPSDPPPRPDPVEWKLPEGWTELPDAGPGQFGRMATIQVSRDDPRLVLAVNRLDGAGSGDLLPNLNRWEAQLGLPGTTPEEAANKAKVIEVDGHAGHRIDLTGTDAKTQSPARLLGFILPHGGVTWSFKLQGAPEKVASQEGAFDAFVASVRFTSHDHGDAAPGEVSALQGAASDAPTTQGAGPASANPAPPAAPGGAPEDNKSHTLKTFTAPPGWVQDPAHRPMRLMTFNVGADNERAELMVTKFAVDRFGTILDNVNRWRGEVGLPPTPDASQENIRELQTPGARTAVFEFAGPPAGPPEGPGAKRSYVAMLRKGGEVWFIKLIGPAQTVADQRANFDAFLQSLQFGDAVE